ncbi:F0F1 ATP synthase subunit delta [uncultured Proteiniphilum sp.]|uniref:F0F1 ATP synthase subunit delta n=1 Tax=uncultured Proteiniphilum sp. TaxID=497637 RepID=UPI002611BD58|nr:F0F1 ATP synthase subunit delta [uncultured Proteiniphilum sp.]
MNTGLISSRYADSLLQYAVSLGQQQEVYDKIKLLSEIFMKMPGLRSAMMNPSIARQDKKKILMTACSGSMPSSLSKMIDLILKNEREEVLQYIALRFIDLYREKFNIRSGRLVTAISIDHETELQLIARIRKMVNTEVEMESEVDPGIIGGFVLTLGDLRWDASISGELTRIKNNIQ